MTYVSVLPSLHVADFDGVLDWYQRLFGRAPDRRPMDGDAEWQLTETAGLQLYSNPETPVAATVILGVDDLSKTLADIAGRGIHENVGTQDVSSGQIRIAQLHDPAGNTIVLAQSLT
jgi:predicted enzyme related to lactoylglutathione lyase